MRLEGPGRGLELPPGWDGRIFQRPEGLPILHAANFPLPVEDGDFGSGALSSMEPDGVFIALVEYDPASAGFGLFGHPGPPLPLKGQDFSGSALQRRIPGQFGVQRFFTAAGRALCLYVVVGSQPSPRTLVGEANTVLRTLAVSA